MRDGMTGRTVLVTGANSGIGYETSRALARLGARVVLAVRDPAKGEEARRRILAEVPGARLDVARVDLARLADVRRLADDVRRDHARLDVLVNNAGIHTARRVLTEDGFESTFAVNHLAPFLLTLELLPLLRASAPARIVNVASQAHRYGWLRLDDLQMSRRWSGWLAYAQSKLANILFTFALARRLEGAGVTANALHPGAVRTGWARGRESGAFRFLARAADPFLISAQRGARTSVHLASAPEVEGVSGRYFVRTRPVTPSAAARDVAAQEALWRASEAMVAPHRASR